MIAYTDISTVLEQEGFWCFAFPIGIACGIAKLNELGQKVVHLRLLSIAIQTTLYSSTVDMMLLILPFALADKSPDCSVEAVVFVVLTSTCNMLGWAWLYGIAPVFGIVVFVVLEVVAA